MGLIFIAPGGTATISQSETDSVSASAGSTLNIAGTAANPITVTLSQVASVGALSTFNIGYANVVLNGPAGVSADVNYRIGDGGVFSVGATAAISAGNVVSFSGNTGRLNIPNVAAFNQLNSVAGFGTGNTIDITSNTIASTSYASHTGSNTGGDLTLYDASHNTVATLNLTTGTYSNGNFTLTSDGSGGTAVGYTTLVTGVTDSPANATLGVNGAVTFTVAMQNPVTVTGTPKLLLNDGGVATYNPAASTSTALAYTYTVAAGQNTSDLAITGSDLTGATITAVGGGGVNLAGEVTNPAGTLVVDTTPPTIIAAVVDTPNAALRAGNVVTFTLTPSEAVTVLNGTPTLSLNDGGTAIFDAAGSTATSLRFRHTIQAGQNAADLAITGLNAAGSTLADAAGNALTASSVIINPAGTLIVDTTAPVVTSVTASPASGTLQTGQSVVFTVGVSEPVTSTGATPMLLLSDGGTATFDAAGSTATQLLFAHIVQAGQTTADLAVTGVSSGGTTIADSAGNALALSGAIGNPAGTLLVGGTSGGSTGGGTTGTDGNSGTGGTNPFPDILVYRFFESTNGTHFYTTSASERDQILATRPDLVSEGPDGIGLRAVNPANNDSAAAEVYRFFDTVHGTQFLTSSASERDGIIASRPDLVYEPQGNFFEHTQPQAGDTAVYRFFSSVDGTHFYTDSEAERATILQTRPDLIAEGVGFYEPK